MKILFLTQLLPYPAHTGGTYKTYSILSLLAKKHSIHVVTFNDKKYGQKDARKLEKFLKIKVKSFYRPVVTKPNKDIKHIAMLSLFSKKPYRVYKYFDKRALKYLLRKTKSVKFDLIYIDHNTSFQYLPFIHRLPKTKIVFDEHNINSLAMWRNFKETKRRLHVRVFSLIDVVKNYLYEGKIAKSVDFFLCISVKDKNYFIKRGANPKTTKVLPVPFKTKKNFQPDQKQQTILFAGLMSWAPNKFGVLWFSKKVYPIIKNKIPNIRLFLVGPRPEKEIHSLAKSDRSITVTGEVPSLSPYYKKTSVFVAPTFSGSGLRIKIPNALASGIPVVTTSLGAEGLIKKVKSGVLIADNETDFSEAIIKLIKDKKLARKLSVQGVNYVKKYYSQKASERVINSIL